RRLVALLFMDPHCRQCASLLPDLERWHATRPDIAFAVLTPNTDAATQAKLGSLGVVVLADADLVVGRALGVSKTPTAVLVSPRRRTLSPLALGADAIRALLNSPGHAGEPPGSTA